MSWKQAGGKLVSGPPTASSSSKSNDRRFKQNTGGLNAFQREQQFAAHYGRHDTHVEERGRTDWDVLKENHRFIRDDEDSGDVSWEERLARAYESKLFKEFALVSPPFTALKFGRSCPPAFVCCLSILQSDLTLEGIDS
jgi:protein FRA10AC1